MATLGWRRAAYIECVGDERPETLLSRHEHAFLVFGGVPRAALYNKMRTVMRGRAAGPAGITQHAIPDGAEDGCGAMTELQNTRITAAADIVMLLEIAQRRGRLKEVLHRTVNTDFFLAPAPA